MKKIEVVAGILKYEDKIFCAQRAKNKLEYVSEKFEFPGGKIEIGETKIDALKRELQEELKINPKITDFYLTVIHNYPDFELTMHSFICEVQSQEVTLTEHKSFKWLEIADLLSLDWAAADVPIVNKLILDA